MMMMMMILDQRWPFLASSFARSRSDHRPLSHIFSCDLSSRLHYRYHQALQLVCQADFLDDDDDDDDDDGDDDDDDDDDTWQLELIDSADQLVTFSSRGEVLLLCY